MWAVHFLSKAIPDVEYGNFGALLAVVMLLPVIPLQMVLAQQTAKALATDRRRELSGVIRLALLSVTVCWVIGAIIVLMVQTTILNRWHMESPVGLWVTLGVVLLSLWLPLFWGALQGQQNFFWLGWSMMSNGVARLCVAAIAVLILHGSSVGIMAGVLVGVLCATVIGAWQTREPWLCRAESFPWPVLLRQIVPLFLAFLGFQVLFTADIILVKAYFPNEAGFYNSAGVLSRALMWLVLPLASVMFPRLVHSAAKSEKTNIVGLVLVGTGLLAIVGAISLSLVGPLVVKVAFKQSFVGVASAVLPWYAAAMVPLALANVLINELLAKPASSFLPALCIFLLALGYVITLTFFHGTLVTILQVLGVFNTILLLVCAAFTWGPRLWAGRPATNQS